MRSNTDITLIDNKLEDSLILLVDDMEFNLIILQEVLSSRGFNNTMTARNGVEALNLTKQQKPDLIILDLLMPELDGFGFCRALRQDPEIAEIPVLVQTALTVPEQRTNAFNSGATDFVNKPVDAEELIARTIVRLERKKLIENLRTSQRRMEMEFNAAREMQTLIIPSESSMGTASKRYNIAINSCFRTSSELGGDFWGITPISDTKFALFMTDFSGHGVTAALNTFRLHTIMNQIELDEDAGVYMGRVNAHITKLLSPEQFATMFYSIIDIEANTMNYAVAGTTSPIHIKNDLTVTPLSGHGIPLGIVNDDSLYKSETIDFLPEYSLFLFSDALIETGDALGAHLSEEALVEFIQNNVIANQTTNLSRYTFHDVVKLYDADYGANQRDDLTIIALSRLEKTL